MDWLSGTQEKEMQLIMECASFRCWIIPTLRYAKLDPRQFHGSAYGIVAAKKGFLKEVGEWNEQEVIVRGSTITVFLNDEIILDADVSKVKTFMSDKQHPGLSLKEGHFGFAGHNDPVAFRNIRIKELY